MARQESKFTTCFGDPCAELRGVRGFHGKTLQEWGQAAGIDASVLSRIECGKMFPRREQLLEWTASWGLSSEEEDGLLARAGMLPRLPEGIDHKMLSGAVKELFGLAPEQGCLETLRSRIHELNSA
jgi:transcriptional regulator with XRE-family HTH domain